MPIVIFILLVILIAQVGFWDTLGAILGAALMLFLFLAVVAALVGLVGYLVFQRARRGL